MIEQFWYCWATRGVESRNAGQQVRAASSGILSEARLVEQCSALSIFPTKIKAPERRNGPVVVRTILDDGRAVVLHKVLALDKRPFVHGLVGPSEKLTAVWALERLASVGWATAPSGIPEDSIELPTIAAEIVDEDFPRAQNARELSEVDLVAGAFEALHVEGGRLSVAVPPGDTDTLLSLLTCIPPAWLRWVSVSSHEASERGDHQVVGIVSQEITAPQIVQPVAPVPTTWMTRLGSDPDRSAWVRSLATVTPERFIALCQLRYVDDGPDQLPARLLAANPAPNELPYLITVDRVLQSASAHPDLWTEEALELIEPLGPTTTSDHQIAIAGSLVRALRNGDDDVAAWWARLGLALRRTPHDTESVIDAIVDNDEFQRSAAAFGIVADLEQVAATPSAESRLGWFRVPAWEIAPLPEVVSRLDAARRLAVTRHAFAVRPTREATIDLASLDDAFHDELQSFCSAGPAPRQLLMEIVTVALNSTHPSAWLDAVLALPWEATDLQEVLSVASRRPDFAPAFARRFDDVLSRLAPTADITTLTSAALIWASQHRSSTPSPPPTYVASPSLDPPRPGQTAKWNDASATKKRGKKTR